MRRVLFIFLLSVSSLFALELENLLNDIKKDSSKQLQEEKQRLEEFKQNSAQQKQLLEESKKQLKTLNKQSEKLKTILDKNEDLLAQKEMVLKEKTGDLGEMFGSVRQASADFLTSFQNSLTATQTPKREVLFEELSNSKKLPNIQKLENLWHAMLDEIIKSGNVEKYPNQVILNNGEKVIKEITRVGLFSAKAEDKYFIYSDDMKSLIELSTQPSSVGSSPFSSLSSDKNSFVIDPTRGTLFKMLDNQPTLKQRIEQGGIVGYIIILLGLLGLLFALYKIVILNLYSKQIKKQMKNLTKADESNSLGKLIVIFNRYKKFDINDLEIKMAEAILKETNKVKKGQSFVKLLSAVTPLLGLLGTVTGMIATFQAITLFGTGDPKLMAGGISTALITTVLGLVTAIPLLFSYTYISSKSENIVSILEEQGMGMLAKSLK